MLKIIKLIKKSRPVKFKDIFRVLIDSWKIKWLMRMPFEGRFPNASSISHCQLEGTQNDPLRFFVLGNDIHLFRDSRGQVKYKPIKLKKYFGFPYPRTIINPEIIWHNEKLIKSREGCMSQPDTPPTNVMRWEIIDCKYWTFFGPKRKKFYLYRAVILQHEIDHFNLISLKERKQMRYDERN